MIDWHQIRDIIAPVFDRLVNSIVILRPDVQVSSDTWMIRSGRFPLYVYRSFSIPQLDFEVDSVVTGIQFKHTDTGFHICGDVCGEANGTIFAEHEMETGPSQSELETASRILAAVLEQKIDVIVQALDFPELVKES